MGGAGAGGGAGGADGGLADGSDDDDAVPLVRARLDRAAVAPRDLGGPRAGGSLGGRAVEPAEEQLDRERVTGREGREICPQLRDRPPVRSHPKTGEHQPHDGHDTHEREHKDRTSTFVAARAASP